MKFDVTFSETEQRFAVRFGEVQVASDGGYERGYADGEKDGFAKGETAGFEKGYESGVTQSFNDGMDAIVNQTATYYFNDKITKMPVAFFQGNVYLETIEMTALTHVSSFLGCTALKNVYFPNAQYIQSGVFKNCSSLEVLDFPKAEQIHSGVFENCVKLKTLILRGAAVSSLSSSASFKNTPIESGTGFIYVPDNIVEAYKAASQWSALAAQIRPLSELS